MANNNLLGAYQGMFQTPQMVRDKRMQGLMDQSRQVSQMGGSMQGLLGQVAAGGSVLGRTLAEGIGQLGGLQTRQEQAALQQSQQARQMYGNNLEQLIQLRTNIMNDPNANPMMLQALDQRITALQGIQQKKSALAQTGDMIRQRYGNEEMATAVESGGITAKDAITALEKDRDLTVSGNRVLNRAGNVIREFEPEQYEVLTTDQKREMGLNPDATFQRNVETGKVTQVDKPDTVIKQFPNPPKDYMYKTATNADGSESVWMEVIPGSQTADELATKERKGTEKAQNWSVQNDFMIRSLADLIKTAEADPEAASGRGARFVQDALRIPLLGSLVATTDPADFQAQLQTVVSNIGFDKLQRMREESPTGGALGQVAVKELLDLQASLGNLSVNQKPTQMIENLQGILERYVSYAVTMANAYDTDTLLSYGLHSIAQMSEAINSGQLDPATVTHKLTQEALGEDKPKTVNFEDF